MVLFATDTTSLVGNQGPESQENDHPVGVTESGHSKRSAAEAV